MNDNCFLPKSLFPLVKSLFIVAVAILLIPACSHHRPGHPRILVFSKTTGYHHESIADGNIALQKLGAQNGFDVDTTTDAGWFTDDSLRKYSAVVFLSTTGD